jgi:hypothetical protein
MPVLLRGRHLIYGCDKVVEPRLKCWQGMKGLYAYLVCQSAFASRQDGQLQLRQGLKKLLC